MNWYKKAKHVKLSTEQTEQAGQTEQTEQMIGDMMGCLNHAKRAYLKAVEMADNARRRYEKIKEENGKFTNSQKLNIAKSAYMNSLRYVVKTKTLFKGHLRELFFLDPESANIFSDTCGIPEIDLDVITLPDGSTIEVPDVRKYDEYDEYEDYVPELGGKEKFIGGPTSYTFDVQDQENLRNKEDVERLLGD